MRLSTLYWKESELPYTGVELRPHFLLERFGQKGSSLVAFTGPCDVKTEHLVDWEDRLASDHIRAAKMVHFIGEFFGLGLREGVILQRLLMASMGETLGAFLAAAEPSSGPGTSVRGGDAAAPSRGPGTPASGKAGPPRSLRRNGDDLFVDERKLTVSIVTASPVSILLHAGVNIDPAGAPVLAIGLAELGVEISPWISGLLARFRVECESIEWACAKVRPVM